MEVRLRHSIHLSDVQLLESRSRNESRGAGCEYPRFRSLVFRCYYRRELWIVSDEEGERMSGLSALRKARTFLNLVLSDLPRYFAEKLELFRTRRHFFRPRRPLRELEPFRTRVHFCRLRRSICGKAMLFRQALTQHAACRRCGKPRNWLGHGGESQLSASSGGAGRTEPPAEVPIRK